LLEVVVPVTKTSPLVSMAKPLAISDPLPERYVEYCSAGTDPVASPFTALTNTWHGTVSVAIKGAQVLPASGTVWNAPAEVGKFVEVVVPAT